MKILNVLILVFIANINFAQNNISSLPKKIDQALGGVVHLPAGGFVLQNPEEIITFPKDDTLLMSPRPSIKITVPEFFIQKTEVTNAQYRTFVQWVRDSIAHAISGHWIENGSGGRDIDWSQKLDWTVGGELHHHLFANELSGAYIFDIRKLVYPLDSEEIRIYPDTLCWIRDFAYSYSNQMTHDYFNNAQYNDYPVVGINWWQAMAYCHWKQGQINKLLAKDGLPSVSVRLPTIAEWQKAATADPQKNAHQDANTSIRSPKIYPWEGDYLVDKNNRDLANYGIIKDMYGIYTKSFIDNMGNYPKNKINQCGGHYTSQTGCFPPNNIGLYDMGGNVAEWTYETPNLSRMRHPADSSDITSQQKNSKLDYEAFYEADSMAVRAWAMDLFRWNASQFALTMSLDDFMYINYPYIPLIWRDIKIAYRGGYKRVAMGGSWAQPPAYMLVSLEAAYAPTDTKSWLGFRTVVVKNQ